MSPIFTDSQLKAIVLAGWGDGVSATVLAKFLKIKMPNCITEIVKPLTKMGVFYYGDAIKTAKRGRPRRLLHLKNNPYLLGDIRGTLYNRRRACYDKMEEASRSYEWHKHKTEIDVYKRKMTPEEEIEFYQQSGLLRGRVRLDREY